MLFRRLLVASPRVASRVAFPGLLAALAGWVWLGDERASAARSGPVVIDVVALVDAPGGRLDPEALDVARAFLARGARDGPGTSAVEAWLAGEHRVWTGGSGPAPVRLRPAGVRPLPPPPSEPPGAGPLARCLAAWRLQGYLRGLEASPEPARARKGPPADATVYLCLWDLRDRARNAALGALQPVASPGESVAAVFSPASPGVAGHIAALLAHEVCHLLGASDKYRDGRSRWPEGYAAPRRVPRWPQANAEIMALGIPRSPEADAPVPGLGRCVVGAMTAQELGWTPER